MKIKKDNLLLALEVLKGIIKIKLGTPVPFFCVWEVTYNCNMKCPFCYVKKYKNPYKPEITTKEAINIIDQLSELGTRMINFSGGEPTLRKDFPLLIEHAKKRKMKVFFNTNGSLIRQRADELLKADLIRVSVDGTKDLHDKLRSFPGAFEKAVEGIRMLKDKGANVMINTVVTSETTFETMKYMAEIAKSLGVQVSYSMIVSSLQTREHPTQDMLDEEQTNLKADENEFIRNVRRLRKEFKGTVDCPKAYLDIIKDGGLKKFGCHAMDITIAIKPNGAISMPCGDFPLKIMNGKIKNVYYSPEAKKMRKIQGKYWFCKKCYVRCMVFPTMLLNFKSLFSIAKSWRDV